MQRVGDAEAAIDADHLSRARPPGCDLEPGGHPRRPRTLFIPLDLISGLDTEYARLDLAIYSPLSLELGVGAAIVARGPHPHHGVEEIDSSTMPDEQAAA